jgi:hypothetical protein
MLILLLPNCLFGAEGRVEVLDTSVDRAGQHLNLNQSDGSDCFSYFVSYKMVQVRIFVLEAVNIIFMCK